MKWWAETDQFECVDNTGAVITIVVHQQLSEPGSGGQGLIQGPPAYNTLDGQQIERLDAASYRLTETGSILGDYLAVRIAFLLLDEALDFFPSAGRD